MKLFPSFGARRELCGIAMEGINGGIMELRIYKELRLRLTIFKVQGMGHGRLEPERRSARFEMAIARGNQFGQNCGHVVAIFCASETGPRDGK